MGSRPAASGSPAAAAVVTGLLAGALLAWGVLRRLSGKHSGAGRDIDLGFTPRRLSQRQSLESLKRAILGARKQTLVEAFGPPRASGSTSLPEEIGSAYWTTDTWYYSLDPAQKAALAIHFVSDTARKVEFIRAPEGT